MTEQMSRQDMSDLNKLKYILNPNPDLSPDICTFIKQSLELRLKVYMYVYICVYAS